MPLSAGIMLCVVLSLIGVILSGAGAHGALKEDNNGGFLLAAVGVAALILAGVCLGGALGYARAEKHLREAGYEVEWGWEKSTRPPTTVTPIKKDTESP